MKIISFYLRLAALLVLTLFFTGLIAIINKVQAQGPCSTPVVVDFTTDGSGNTLSGGAIITNQFQSAFGLSVNITNGNSRHPDIGMIFNSSSPTGGDFDLGTPNQAFGGPGMGSGGSSSNNIASILLDVSLNAA